MLNFIVSISTIKMHIFLIFVILALSVFIGYFIIMDRKINRNQHSKFRDRCNAEKTKYYD